MGDSENILGNSKVKAHNQFVMLDYLFIVSNQNYGKPFFCYAIFFGWLIRLFAINVVKLKFFVICTNGRNHITRATNEIYFACLSLVPRSSK
jgi:hypothetical protein